tara:strand:- start:213 stop:554 length:342 start_codon:yes stop_codon:yes gene_type:complete
MDILKPILDIYDVKKDVLLFYLDPDIRKIIDDLDYLDDENDLFLNDKIFIIDRSTLELDHSGIIQAIKGDIVSIKVKSKFSVHINMNNYHIFIKRKKTKKNDRDFYKALLNSL